MMTEDSILELLDTGENQAVEFKQEMPRKESLAGVFHYDATPVARATFNDLNLAKVDAYFQRYEFDFSSQSQKEKIRLLTNSDILTESEEVSLGGLLMFGVNPSRYLPQAGVSFAQFQGNTLDDQLLNKQNIEGNLDYQVQSVCAAIQNHIPVPSKVVKTQRVDLLPSYPEKVFRELLANACVHRDYSITGSKIRVFVFQNRIEIISPGRLPNTVTIDKLKVGVSYARNPILVKFMENLRIMDQLGRGVPMVLQEAKKLQKEVTFEEFGESFKVILER